MNKFALTTMIFLLLNSTATAGPNPSNWRLVAEDSESTIEYDLGNVEEPTDDTRLLWIRNTQKKDKKLIDTIYTKSVINCKNWTFDRKEIYAYKKGKLVEFVTNGKSNIIPDTISDSIARIVCNNNQKPIYTHDINETVYGIKELEKVITETNDGTCNVSYAILFMYKSMMRIFEEDANQPIILTVLKMNLEYRIHMKRNKQIPVSKESLRQISYGFTKFHNIITVNNISYSMYGKPMYGTTEKCQ